MISPSELLGVIDDIKRVGKAADLDPGHLSEDDDDQSENSFLPRAYDIDRLHADDARDKVFVAILKALVARHNRPSSPKELSNCIMRHEFTVLGGATPYATVSSRISQHFKRILEHIPPRPPILGRVAHEKHTRKYFYYVASAAEQDDFLRKVRAGIIPINASSGTGANAGSEASRKLKHTKKVRCLVPAVAVEPDFIQSTAIRRTRRAASADTTNVTTVLPMSSSKDHLHTAPTAGRSASGASARPRRTSYDCGSLTRDSSADEHAETDSDTNPYARKRYKSVRSIVAQAYPRRQPRRQSGSAAPTPPRTRRSASYNDASSGGGSAVGQVSPTGAGKWRPSSHSDDESDHGSIKRESGDEDVDMAASDGDESDNHYGFSATTDQTLVSSKGGRPRRRRQDSDSASALGTATGRRRNDLAVDVKTLTPPPPNTTPRASASPDRTPYPPATSPSFHHLRRSKRDSDASSAADSRSSRHKSASSGELQIASPLLLPRGMVSLPLDGGSIFGTSSITDAALNVEPIAASSSYISPEVPLRHFTPTPVSTSTLEGMQTDETHVEMNEDDRMEPSGVEVSSVPLKEDQKSAAVSAQDGDAVKSPESVSVKTEQSIDSSDMELSGGGSSSSSGGFDFTFHDLMDAELMSLNELDKLWTNSNPMASSYLDSSDSYASRSMLEPIPEATMEDSNDITGGDVAVEAEFGKERNAGDSRTVAAADSSASSAVYAQTEMLEAAAPNDDDGHRELSTRLTQRLLALKAGSITAPTDREATNHAQRQDEEKEEDEQDMLAADHRALLEQGAEEPTTASSGKTADASDGSDAKPMDLDSVEPTNVLAENSKEHEETVSASSAAKSNRVILPDPFGDITPTAMVATKVPVSPRIVLTIVETVPVYMTVITTTEPAADCQGKWIVRRHRLLRLVENGYVNASSLLLSGGVASEQERSIVLSLEVGRFKWRRPQSKLYGTWIPLPRARALAATCSLNHRLGPFLNDNLESYFPAPLPTSFIRHLIMPFFSDSAGMLLSPSQPELDATSAAFSSDASALLAKETPTSEAAAVAAAATGKESGVSAESSEVATAIAATELSESAQTDDIMPVVSSHPVVTSTALSSTEAKASATSTASAANALFGSELGIGIQNMANSAMASYAQSLLRQPKQSISRSSTFGATARGTPSPSIIQSLATRGGGGALNFAGAAKAIFGSDDRQLQSFLQLLSAESPMLSTSIASEFQADSHSPRSSRAGSPAASSAEAATTSITAVAPEAQDAGDPSLLPSPFGTKPEVKAMINDLAKSTLADGGYLASLVKEALTNKTGRQAERADASNATAEDSRIATPVSPGDASTVSGTRSSGDVGGSDDPKLATGLLSTDAKAESGIVGYGTDQKDTDTLAETEVTSLDTTRFGDSMDVDSAEQSDDDLDLRMVFSADDDDMDMICRSTPPSPPPPPPHTLPRLRKLSSTPLLLSRPESPALSESLSSAGDHTLLNDQGHEHLTKQQQHGIGSFNARLAQSMEAFGFTGTAKTSLLLRLRAAAAAKSTGRQQAVAPYMLYRSSAGAGGVGIAAAAAAGAGGASSSGAGSGGYKRSRLGLNDVDINGVLAGGVRKRARVIRVSRAKPGSKQAAGNGAGTSSSSSQLANKGANGVRGRNKGTPAVPDASVVLRLASAIYNHTLNLTALAHSQRQAAAAAAAEAAHNAGGDGSTSSTQSATPAGSSAEGKRSSTGGPSTSGGGSGGIRNKQQLLHGSVPKAQMGMRSPENGRLPATMVGRPPQRPSPSRPSPQQQKASSIAGNRAVPPRPPALTQQQQQQQQQRPAMQRPLGGGSPRPTMQPPRGHQSPVRPPLNGNRPPANNAVQRMPPQGLQRQSPRPSSSGVGVGVPSQQQQQQRPMVRRPPLPQQPRPRPGAPIRGPAQRPPGQQQQQPSVGRPTGAATPPTLQRPPLLRSGATGSPKQTNNAQQQQQQQLDTPAVTSAAAAATTPAVSINSAKTHKPQKAS